MKYCQLDRITTLVPGKKIVAERTLRGDEEYLKDHFPRFPVMPGVMMLEALHQAAVWMIRTESNFEQPIVLLREVRNVKFGDFLAPDQTLQVTAEVIKESDGIFTVKAIAQKEGRTTVSARLILERSGSNDPVEIGTDEDVKRRVTKQFRELFGDVLSNETDDSTETGDAVSTT
ncbi:beta-hydroxyacyl-ACP dehydratase [Stieleria sp. JC731]|uniref:3-hydroxyacyl-ACP dehydratase FabZ family protein n=1 Tax=Pirellulaceae TaxID=2691357 RepID=UPI001E2FB424|nr:3-hydroxyacyl-ACP dehydratase FabZ family protein [Stieleria sp. JC731]MCC9601159.1 beta-hydroxyacyl-ACP dehydratase [Stieleria sp. JC731]